MRRLALLALLLAPLPAAAQGGSACPAVVVRCPPTAKAVGARLLSPLPGAASLSAAASDWRWADDRWTGRDKALHFGASALLTLSGQYVLVQKLDATDGKAAPFSSGGALGLGIAKEVYDARRPGGTGFSFKDLAWDAAGVAAALVVVSL
jgi:putative lipoprotein